MNIIWSELKTVFYEYLESFFEYFFEKNIIFQFIWRNIYRERRIRTNMIKKSRKNNKKLEFDLQFLGKIIKLV